jgi:hypothetical protein
MANPSNSLSKKSITRNGLITYELIDNASHFEIHKIINRGEQHEISFEFSPAIPERSKCKRRCPEISVAEGSAPLRQQLCLQ